MLVFISDSGCSLTFVQLMGKKHKGSHLNKSNVTPALSMQGNPKQGPCEVNACTNDDLTMVVLLASHV